MENHQADRLTVRQREALRLFHHRLDVKQIARSMELSHNTVEHHLTNAATALATDRRSAATWLAQAEMAGCQPVGRFSANDPALDAILAGSRAGQTQVPTWPLLATLFSLRRGAQQDDRTIYQRLLPVPIIAIGIAIALAAVVFALDHAERYIRW